MIDDSSQINNNKRRISRPLNTLSKLAIRLPSLLHRRMYLHRLSWQSHFVLMLRYSSLPLAGRSCMATISRQSPSVKRKCNSETRLPATSVPQNSFHWYIARYDDTIYPTTKGTWSTELGSSTCSQPCFRCSIPVSVYGLLTAGAEVAIDFPFCVSPVDREEPIHSPLSTVGFSQ